MSRELKTMVYDDVLRIEACHFGGIAQPFPNHFHEHYVIGFVEDGRRILSCKNNEYSLEKGNIVLFNPGDNHACSQSDGGTFDYRGFNISKDVMLDFTEEVTGKRTQIFFSQNVIFDNEINCCLHLLHEMVMNGTSDLGKEENLLFLISTLIQKYGQQFVSCVPDYPNEIEKACEFMKKHFREHIYLEQLCSYIGLSKSTLLRAFTRTKGVTPYRYLETIRINEAKALLEKGVPPIDAAMQTGFSDQSHFTNYFSRFIGIAPGVYRDIFFEKDGGLLHGE